MGNSDLTDYLLRLAIALPLVLAAMVTTLVALKRGWLKWPPRGLGASRLRLPGRAALTDGAPPLQIMAMQSLGPAARIAVLRFAGTDLLVGVAGTGVTLLASAPPLPASSALQPERQAA